MMVAIHKKHLTTDNQVGGVVNDPIRNKYKLSVSFMSGDADAYESRVFYYGVDQIEDVAIQLLTLQTAGLLQDYSSKFCARRSEDYRGTYSRLLASINYYGMDILRKKVNEHLERLKTYAYSDRDKDAILRLESLKESLEVESSDVEGVVVKQEDLDAFVVQEFDYVMDDWPHDVTCDGEYRASYDGFTVTFFDADGAEHSCNFSTPTLS